MNIYRYKNCLKFNVWNCILPQINGHVICIFNIISKEFRLFKFGTWGGLTWYKNTPLTEIKDIEPLRDYIKKTITKRIRRNSSEFNPDGTIDIIDSIVNEMDLSYSWKSYKPGDLLDIYLKDFFFLFDNYVGDINKKEEKVSDYYENWDTYYKRILPELNKI